MQNKILGGQGYENEKINQRTFGCSMCAFISSMWRIRRLKGQLQGRFIIKNSKGYRY